MAEEKSAKVFYCREIIEKLVSVIQNSVDCVAADELCKWLRAYPFIVIRFINKSSGLTATMEILTTVFRKLSEDHAVIITGDYLDQYVPELLQQLPASEKFFICH